MSGSSLSLHEKRLEPCIQGLGHCLSRSRPWPHSCDFNLLGWGYSWQDSWPLCLLAGLRHISRVRVCFKRCLLTLKEEKSCLSTVFAWYRKYPSPHWEAAAEQLCRPMKVCSGWCIQITVPQGSEHQQLAGKPGGSRACFDFCSILPV